MILLLLLVPIPLFYLTLLMERLISSRMEFESEEAVKAFYNSYACRRIGSALGSTCPAAPGVMVPSSRLQMSFVCAKEGFRMDKSENRDPECEGRMKRPRAETRVSCKAMFAVKIQDSGGWIVSTFVREHHHD